MGNTDLFEAYFKRADLDGDGQISGAEAVAFFQASGLPKHVLAQVWTYADQKNAGYLGRQEFYNALKLVTVAQSKRELTPDIVKAALYSPASAKIPAPQISIAATPVSKVGAPTPHFVGTASGATSQNMPIRPPQAIGSVSINQQFFPVQQNQYVRPLQAIPSSTVSHPQQVPASQGMPQGSNMAVPRPPTSNISSDWLDGSTGGPSPQIANRGISPHAVSGGFAMTSSGLTPSVQPRPQTTTGQVISAGPNPEVAAVVSSQPTTKDSKQAGISENGSASNSLFGDVFAASPVQPKQVSSSVTPSGSSLPASSLIVPSPAAPQASAKPSPLDSLQSTFSQKTGGVPLTDRPVSAQGSTVPLSTQVPVGAENSVSSQLQMSWPRMSQSDIQKYVKVFVEVDRDRNGKITGVQARNLFLSWRLPREVLKQVWDLSDQDGDSMLSLREFCIALYLMERYREGRPLPTTLPSSVMSDETLLSITSHPTPHASGTWGPPSGVKHSQTMTGTYPPSAAAPKPPRPPSVSHAAEKQPSQLKPKVPVLEKHLVDQLSQEEQDSLNSKFQEAARADKEVEQLEKEILESRQKIEFLSAKMQELVLYRSRCDNRLNEVRARVAADRNEVEALAKKYEEKYKQTGDVASKLTIEEATFRDIQERKMELYRAIVKMEEGGTAVDVLKERVEHIQSGLEELAKSVNERCKQYGLRSKATSLVELPFGWQPGIQEGAADWDEDWDKFEDEGLIFVKELTLDVQNVVAPPKTKSSLVQNETPSISEDNGASPSNAELKSQNVQSPGERNHEKKSAHHRVENGVSRSSSDSSAGRSATESRELRNSPVRESAGADGSLHSKEIQSDMGGAESVISGDKSVDESHTGAFDTHYDTESLWALRSSKGMDHEGHETSIFGGGDFGLNPIRTWPSIGKSSSLFADSVPGTPAYDQGKSSFMFDSVPSTPAYDQQRSSTVFDSVPSTPAYNQGKSTLLFADSVPSTPSYNFGNSPRRFGEGSEDHSFDSFSRFDSFGVHDAGLFQSSRPSLARFDSMHSTVDSDQNYGFPSRFDSFRESRDSEQSHGFSRFDSFRDSDQSHGFSRFDSFRDSDHSHGFPARFDSFRESKDSDPSYGFSRFDSFGAHDSGGNSLSGFDSTRGSRDPDNSHGFSSFDDADPFGSSGPFRTSLESETPRKSSESWRAF